MIREVLSVREAADYLGVGVWTVYEYCRQGVIPHRKVGRRILIARRALEGWLAAGGERSAGGREANRPWAGA